jgi:uncharacterized membrane protein YczE
MYLVLLSFCDIMNAKEKQIQQTNNFENMIYQKQEKKRLKFILRILVYLGGLTILVFGVTLNINTSLGVAAITSIPYTISHLLPITVGEGTSIMCMLYIAAQLLLLGKKNFRFRILLQFPVSIAFGYLTDLFHRFINIPVDNYIARALALIFAILFTALGIMLTISADIAPNPPDGIVQVIAEKSGKELGTVKNYFDIGCVLISVIIGLIFLHKIVGIGLGTLITAIVVGRVVAFFNKLWRDKIRSVLI